MRVALNECYVCGSLVPRPLPPRLKDGRGLGTRLRMRYFMHAHSLLLYTSVVMSEKHKSYIVSFKLKAIEMPEKS